VANYLIQSLNIWEKSVLTSFIFGLFLFVSFSLVFSFFFFVFCVFFFFSLLDQLSEPFLSFFLSLFVCYIYVWEPKIYGPMICKLMISKAASWLIEVREERWWKVWCFISNSNKYYKRKICLIWLLLLVIKQVFLQATEMKLAPTTEFSNTLLLQLKPSLQSKRRETYQEIQVLKSIFKDTSFRGDYFVYTLLVVFSFTNIFSSSFFFGCMDSWRF